MRGAPSGPEEREERPHFRVRWRRQHPPSLEKMKDLLHIFDNSDIFMKIKTVLSIQFVYEKIFKLKVNIQYISVIV